MRDFAEIVFRLRAEAANLLMWLRPPAFPGGDFHFPLPQLPDPSHVRQRLAGSAFAAEVTGIAEEVLSHRVPLLGITLDLGPEIRWRDDLVNGIANPTTPYFRLVPYLDFRRTGDHKIVWELNRHQHLVVLAQAWLFTGRREFLAEIDRQVTSWIAANPFQSGINWTSALEVAFRAMSWIWVLHLAGHALPAQLVQTMAAGLYRHGCHIERNLSIYFSPNTHLLGEAVALHALGALFPGFPRTQRWQAIGARLVEEQMLRQVREDGSHFEQSSYYHLYALDMFLFHQVTAGTSLGFRERLDRMAAYLHALTAPSGLLPSIGDDDGGRWFHPYGSRVHFARATLASCGRRGGEEDCAAQSAWWFRSPVPRKLAGAASEWFPDAGVAVMRSGDLSLIIDAGSFGAGSGGHSHSDTLSIVARMGEEEILIDPGTYTYVADPAGRNWFRGSAAHNTVRINGADQGDPAHPFRWHHKPAVELQRWRTDGEADFLDASCRYRGFLHRRRVLLLHSARLAFVLDDVSGPPGDHHIEQFWHLGSPEARQYLRLPGSAAVPEGGEHGWRSRAFGEKQPAPVVQVDCDGPLPVRLVAVLDFTSSGATLAIDGDSLCYGNLRVVYSEGEIPVVTLRSPA